LSNPSLSNPSSSNPSSSNFFSLNDTSLNPSLSNFYNVKLNQHRTPLRRTTSSNFLPPVLILRSKIFLLFLTAVGAARNAMIEIWS
jgi:hypothetical protein